MPDITLMKTPSYDLQVVQEAIHQQFILLDAGSLIRPGMKVTVKPNLIMRCTPQRTATTHPVVMEAVIRELQTFGAEDITIADSPGGPYTAQLLSAAYGQTGMREVAERCGVKLNLDTGSQPVRLEDGHICREFDLIHPVAQADLVVNVCKLKTHCMTNLSCGIKNLFGCIPGLLKPQLHYRFPDGERFAQMLIDLSRLVRPGLTVVDAVDALEGDGPTGGNRRFVGLTAAARYEGLYSLDLVLAHLIGLTPKDVPMLAEAVSQGLCPADWHAVSCAGDADPDAVIPDFRMPASRQLDFTGNVPKPVAALVRKLEPVLAPKPHVREQDCIGCGRCAQSCPAQTIRMQSHKAKIQLSDCIRCFCCHEMCPEKAIDIRSNPLFRFLSVKKS